MRLGRQPLKVLELGVCTDGVNVDRPPVGVVRRIPDALVVDAQREPPRDAQTLEQMLDGNQTPSAEPRDEK
jgi:hypothetical protein